MLVVAGQSHPDQVLWLALAIAVLMLVIAGASDAISSVFRQTILQTATPDDMRGRLQGVFIVVVAGGPRLGEALLGGAASKIGEGWAAVIGGSPVRRAPVGAGPHAALVLGLRRAPPGPS